MGVQKSGRWVMFFAAFFLLAASLAGAEEIILQYFNTSWQEIARRMPELAEAGYTALWLPTPCKAGSQFSVGYDPVDRFDVGSKYQQGTVATLYGTGTDLLYLMEVAHRFGMRVYFDNIMAHNGGPWPDGYAPGELGPTGFVPEDYHIRRTSDTTYEDNGGPNSSDEWQTLNRTWFGLDIAQESPNTSFGWNEDDDYAKWSGIRHPDNPEYYLDTDLAITSGSTVVYTFANKEPFEDIGYTNSSFVFITNAIGNGRFDWEDSNPNGQHDAGENCEPFEDTGIDPSRADRQNVAWGYGDGIYNMGNPVAEDVNALLFRASRWLTDLAHADGYRLDAVKHVPSYFFGKQDDPKDDSNWGMLGQIQEQFNITRGFSDWDNHRDTVFNNVQARDDAMVFGEHLGEPPWKGGYYNAGMRLTDDVFLNSVKGNIGYTLEGMDNSYYGVASPGQDVQYVMSHDNNYIWGGDREQAHAIMLSREGLPIVYTDGYNQSGEPNWFPKPAEIPFLGQFGASYLPNLVNISRHFGWGYQASRWNAWDYTSYGRYDPSYGDNDHGVTMEFMMAKNYLESWPLCNITSKFPEGARLIEYSYHGGEWMAKVEGGKIVNMDGSSIWVEQGKYYAFSWRTPQMPEVWGEGFDKEVQPITIFQNGAEVGTMSYERQDGRDGDPAFNPYSLPDGDTGDRKYTMTVPRVTDGSNLTFFARADGSAENIMMKLDGGIDLNSQLDIVSQSPGDRDNPPALTQDKFLGFEQMKYIQRASEKFAAQDVSRNIIGSPGAETYHADIGSAGFMVVEKSGGTNTATGTLTWVYHEPSNLTHDAVNPQFDPLPESAADQAIDIWVKIGYSNQPDQAYIYYTTDGSSPEGSCGRGKGTTQVVSMNWVTNGPSDGGGDPEWWKGVIPAQTNGTHLTYKIGAFDDDSPSRFPWSDEDIAVRYRMETQFEITNFNATTIPYYPHNDWGEMAEGLDEGFHVLQTKCILGRAAGDTPIFRQFVQTFYYDTMSPTGRYVWPPSDGWTLEDSTYGVVARSDMTVKDAWYRIEDGDASNDDSATGVANGNEAWAKANQGIVPMPLPGDMLEKEWTFDYVNIPSSGSATIKVRLMEVTSSTNMTLTDEEGHFTTLTRTVATGGSGNRFFITDPVSDGTTVAVNDDFTTYFGTNLAEGLSDAGLKTTFVMRVNGVIRTNLNSSITRDVTPNDHAITYTLPNIYNGQPSYEHTLSIAFSRPGYDSLSAQRWVYAEANDDSNGDGIPDSWETQWGVPVGSIAASSNSDNDIYLNIDEYRANTDPFDDTDYLRIDTAATTTNGSMYFEFDGKSNRNYFVWYTEETLMSTNDWQLATPLIDPIEGQGRTAEFTDITIGRTGRFYRLEVRLPE